MAGMKSWKLGLGFVLCLSFVAVVYFGYYFCHGPTCALTGNSTPTFKSNYDAYLAGRFLQNEFSANELNKDYDIDLENEDVIVFLHIQKTGGSTFGKHLVQNLRVDPPCHCYKRVKKHCDCLTKNNQLWLFSRFTTGWRCGLHADWTELTSCVDQWFQTNQGRKTRKYHYVTLLRDPVHRFISEWMHVRRGATWKTAALKCNGREATLEEVPFCYDSSDWKGVSLQEFIECKHNLAFNRQTRMLANLSTINCYNSTGMDPHQRDSLMLQSAQDNLKKMAFFGLVEFQTYTQFLFEQTLHMDFIDDFVQHNETHSNRQSVSPEYLKKITELNWLDIELYQFAKDLFLQRVQKAYVKEGLHVPESLQQLISGQAVGRQDTVSEGSTEGTGEVGSVHSSDSVGSGVDIQGQGRTATDQFKDSASQRVAGSGRPGKWGDTRLANLSKGERIQKTEVSEMKRVDHSDHRLGAEDQQQDGVSSRNRQLSPETLATLIRGNKPFQPHRSRANR